MNTFKAHKRQMVWGLYDEGLESSGKPGPKGSLSYPLLECTSLRVGWKNKEEAELEADVQAGGMYSPSQAQGWGWGGWPQEDPTGGCGLRAGGRLFFLVLSLVMVL